MTFIASWRGHRNKTLSLCRARDRALWPPPPAVETVDVLLTSDGRLETCFIRAKARPTKSKIHRFLLHQDIPLQSLSMICYAELR